MQPVLQPGVVALDEQSGVFGDRLAERSHPGLLALGEIAEHISMDQRLIAGVADAALPPILAGDFNASPDSDEIRMLTGRTAVAVPGLVFQDAWELAGDGGRGCTWVNANPWARADLEPDRRIDYVFAGLPRWGGVGHVVACGLAGGPVDGLHPSDHLAVVVELRY